MPKYLALVVVVNFWFCRKYSVIYTGINKKHQFSFLPYYSCICPKLSRNAIPQHVQHVSGHILSTIQASFQTNCLIHTTTYTLLHQAKTVISVSSLAYDSCMAMHYVKQTKANPSMKMISEYWAPYANLNWEHSLFIAHMKCAAT